MILATWWCFMSDLWNPYYVTEDFAVNAFYSAFIRNCKGEYFFQGETHDFWEFCYVIKGSACMSVDDKVIRLCENQIIFHKPMEFHSLRTDDEKQTALLIVSFSASGNFMDYFKDKTFTLGHSLKQEVARIIAYLKNISEYNDEDEMPIIALNKMSESSNAIRFFKNMVENMLISLSAEGESRVQIVKNSETDIYTEALRIINSYCYEKLTVNELALKCNVSSAYLKKIFAKYNGLGIHEYILQNKISIAKQMLSEGEPVTTVADSLGFSSQNYFSTAFKRKTGVSPSEYKVF